MEEPESPTSRVVELPLLPLRATVILPGMTARVFDGRACVAKALDAAEQTGGRVVGIAQLDSSQEDPGPEGLHRVGVVLRVVNRAGGTGATARVLLEALARARLLEVRQGDGFPQAICSVPGEIEAFGGRAEASGVSCERAKAEIAVIAATRAEITKDSMENLMAIEDSGRLADGAAALLIDDPEERQLILEEEDPAARLTRLCEILRRGPAPAPAGTTRRGATADPARPPQVRSTRARDDEPLRLALSRIESLLVECRDLLRATASPSPVGRRRKPRGDGRKMPGEERSR